MIQDGYKYPVDVTDDAQHYYFAFSFNRKLMEEIKTRFRGAKWMGYEKVNPQKIWRVDKCPRNEFQLEYMQGNNPFARYDTPVDYTKLSWERPLYFHQKDLTVGGLVYKQGIWAAEPGCIYGDAEVHCNVAKKGMKITLRKLFDLFNSSRRQFPIYIRSLCDGVLKLNEVKNVLNNGKKATLRIGTKMGYSIWLTPDHKVAISNTDFLPANQLKIGDKILVNGKWVSKDGYIKIGGLKNKHPNWKRDGVSEHVLVMEKYLGRYLTKNEIVHHKDGNRTNNKLDNLEILTPSEHGKLHGKTNFVNMNSKKCIFYPMEDEIESITDGGEKEVFDVVCSDPYRNFVADGIIVHNCGKTLSAIELMERVYKLGIYRQWYVAPKGALPGVKLIFKEWKSKISPLWFTYDELKGTIKKWNAEMKAPQLIIFDEAQKLRNETSQRSQVAGYLADEMRREYKNDCYVILMTGTPAPKSPFDYYRLCEIACPGYLKEGSIHKFKERMAITQLVNDVSGGRYPKLVAYRDGKTHLCNICGESEKSHETDPEIVACSKPGDYHTFIPMKDEVSALYRRMKGLTIVKLKSECLDLPKKVYKIIQVPVDPQLKQAAALIKAAAPNAMVALTLLRELSDGFQYGDKVTGHETCPDCKGKKTIIVGNAEPIACPFCKATGEKVIKSQTTTKIDSSKLLALQEELETDFEDDNRIVIFAGFQASVDLVNEFMKSIKWKTIRIDGRGWESELSSNPVELLEKFQQYEKYEEKIAIVGHPASGGIGNTYTASKGLIYYSNSFAGEDRMQSEDRLDRPGCRGQLIVDLFHLPSDKLVYDNLLRKRELQALSMGDIASALEYNREI